MTWIAYALTAALLQSTTRIANQFFKHDGLHLTFVIKVFQTLFMLPFIFFIPWPENPWFYFFTLITAPLIVYQDKSFFNFTSTFGAGPVTRIEPLSVPFVFIAWLALNPSLLLEQFERPSIFLGTCLCVTAASFFAGRMRKCAVNGCALRAMIPLIFVVGTINLLAKASTDFMPKDSGIIVYIFIQSAFVAMLSFGATARKHLLKKEIANKKMLFTAFGLSLLILGVMILRLWAFKETVNPAYVTAIMLTGPFWTLLINRAISHKETATIRDGLGIVLSVIALTVMSSL